MRMNQKTALVTGGAKGIGEAIVRLLSQEGAKVAIADLAEAEGTALAQELTRAGGQVIFLKSDVTRPEEVERTVKAVAECFGGLDILVNDAGVTEKDDYYLEEEPLEEWDRVMSINLQGTFLNCRYALPYLKKSRGCIVNIASMAGMVALRYCAAYCTSKTGVIGLTRAIAVDYAQFGVRANAVCPGPCETPLLQKYFSAFPADEVEEKVRRLTGPVGRMCQPEEIAQAVLFLASPDSSYITGAAIAVDGGKTAV